MSCSAGLSTCRARSSSNPHCVRLATDVVDECISWEPAPRTNMDCKRCRSICSFLGFFLIHDNIAELLECLSQQLMHWDTFKHNNYCTVRGDGGCRVGKVQAGTTSHMLDHKGFKLQ